MASFFRRRRSIIFKAVIGIPTLWFFAVVLMTFINSDASDDHRKPGAKKRNVESHIHENVLPPENLEPIGGNHIPLNDRESIHRKVHADEQQEFVKKLNVEENDKKLEVDIEESKKEQVKPPTTKKKTYTIDPNAPESVQCLNEMDKKLIEEAGENGKAIIINKDSLSPEERKKYDDGFQKNAFNQYASDMMSLHRSLPDVRDEECKTLKYKENLPDTSVVYRSLDCLSGSGLIKHLGKPLEDYVATLGKVKVVRAKKREGLIRARLLGFAAATGEVVTFLDSHCECAEDSV
ncbi:hypothetical protein KUTeg_008582 [Tegillarca granosa]|uniref:Glycosyltransferase 2-like domain-containing protein n=1 Tax=Tegillarca granosa TaxID=220873 RepID=A0ABQ9FCR9_TEGGR|nr:hypothetical protein KUTeg_008582 [Tegillarca granosa]